MEIWEPKPPGNFWATPGLLRDSFTFILPMHCHLYIHSASTKFYDWHYKSICLKEITLLLFSFRHTSLPTVPTDLHGRTASGCLCRSRPLQYCLMYLSRISGCPKWSQRDAPSSGISLLGTKSNQQVLNLANTEGGRAQSLFVGPKTA